MAAVTERSKLLAEKRVPPPTHPPDANVLAERWLYIVELSVVCVFTGGAAFHYAGLRAAKMGLKSTSFTYAPGLKEWAVSDYKLFLAGTAAAAAAGCYAVWFGLKKLLEMWHVFSDTRLIRPSIVGQHLLDSVFITLNLFVFLVLFQVTTEFMALYHWLSRCAAVIGVAMACTVITWTAPRVLWACLVFTSNVLCIALPYHTERWLKSKRVIFEFVFKTNKVHLRGDWKYPMSTWYPTLPALLAALSTSVPTGAAAAALPIKMTGITVPFVAGIEFPLLNVIDDEFMTPTEATIRAGLVHVIGFVLVQGLLSCAPSGHSFLDTKPFYKHISNDRIV